MQLKLHMVTIENLVPQEHFLPKLEAALDFFLVYIMRQKSVGTAGRPSPLWCW